MITKTKTAISRNVNGFILIVFLLRNLLWYNEWHCDFSIFNITVTNI